MEKLLAPFLLKVIKAIRKSQNLLDLPSTLTSMKTDSSIDILLMTMLQLKFNNLKMKYMMMQSKKTLRLIKAQRVVEAEETVVEIEEEAKAIPSHGLPKSATSLLMKMVSSMKRKLMIKVSNLITVGEVAIRIAVMATRGRKVDGEDVAVEKVAVVEEERMSNFLVRTWELLNLINTEAEAEDKRELMKMHLPEDQQTKQRNELILYLMINH